MPDGATPHDAWEALKEKTGKSPEDFYKALDKKKGQSESNDFFEHAEEEVRNEKKEELSMEELSLKDEFFKEFKNTAEAWNCEYIEVGTKKYDNDSDIIKTIGGGDLTKGSCVSVTLAYIGSKAGFYVTDFRGGESRRFFAGRVFTNIIPTLTGVKSFDNDNVYEDFNGFKAAQEALEKVKNGKEYLFLSGEHITCVKKDDNEYKYLELQSPTSNGYKVLDQKALKERFGTKKARTLHGFKLQQRAVCIPLDEILQKRDALKYMLGYLNTNGKNEMKGADGYEK